MSRISEDRVPPCSFLVTRVEGVHIIASYSEIVSVIQNKIPPARTSFRNLKEYRSSVVYYNGIIGREEQKDPPHGTQV